MQRKNDKRDVKRLDLGGVMQQTMAEPSRSTTTRTGFADLRRPYRRLTGCLGTSVRLILADVPFCVECWRWIFASGLDCISA
jgi:hypothetical protein